MDKSEYGEILDFAWSGDSRWIAYAKPAANNFSRIALYGLEGGKITAVSDGMTDDFGPAFDPAGKYLYFISRRTIDIPAFQFEYAFPYAETDKIYAATLRDTVLSPAAPQSDEELGEEAGKEDKGGKDKAEKGAKDKEHPAIQAIL